MCVCVPQENGNIVPYKMEDVEANNIHIAFQIPQYALMTAGEVMFSITGLEFSYSQVSQLDASLDPGHPQELLS